MKGYQPIIFSIAKAALITTVIVFVLSFILNQTEHALPVQASMNTNVKINDDNLISLVKMNVNTKYLHKLKFDNGRMYIQLHFSNMTTLVEQLNDQIHEHCALYFNTISNINDVTIYVSEQHTTQVIYEIKTTKEDYLAGKSFKIIPLNS